MAGLFQLIILFCLWIFCPYWCIMYIDLACINLTCYAWIIDVLVFRSNSCHCCNWQPTNCEVYAISTWFWTRIGCHSYDWLLPSLKQFLLGWTGGCWFCLGNFFLSFCNDGSDETEPQSQLPVLCIIWNIIFLSLIGNRGFVIDDNFPIFTQLD